MAEQWIIQVLGRDYGPAELSTLREWKADGRVLPENLARRIDVDLWQTAAEIPGLFQVETPPVQRNIGASATPVRAVSRAESRPAIVADAAVTPATKRPTRNILVETFRIYLRGFFQFLALTLLSALPSISGKFVSAMIQTRTDLTPDLRANVADAFVVCMFVLTLVLWPVYVAGIQVITAELTVGRRLNFLSSLNHAVKYWPRVAGLCIFIYGVFILLLAFGIVVLAMMLAAATAMSFFWIIVTLVLAAFQLWLFCRFFVFTLFWQQFAVLENRAAFEALQESSRLAHSGRDLPRHQRPLWRAAVIVSVSVAFLIAIVAVAVWPRLVAEWPVYQEYFNQLTQAQDPQAVLQKLNAALQVSHGVDYQALALNVLQRILQPLLGIAFVVLYLDSKGDDRT